MRKLPIDRLVTHRFALAEVNDALIAMERQEALKPVIVP
jgi:Zn-dependent alcohol dehydrogenase